MYVRRLKVEDSVEQRIFEIQERKGNLSAEALSEESEGGRGGSANSLTLDELKSFFRDTKGKGGEEE